MRAVSVGDKLAKNPHAQSFPKIPRNSSEYLAGGTVRSTQSSPKIPRSGQNPPTIPRKKPRETPENPPKIFRIFGWGHLFRHQELPENSAHWPPNPPKIPRKTQQSPRQSLPKTPKLEAPTSLKDFLPEFPLGLLENFKTAGLGKLRCQSVSTEPLSIDTRFFLAPKIANFMQGFFNLVRAQRAPEFFCTPHWF